VTAFEFVAHPTTDVFFGKIAFPASEAASVLAGWVDYLRDAPEELTSTVEFANPSAGGPGGPAEIHVAFDGDEPGRANQAIDPIRALGTAIYDDVALVPYPDTLEEVEAPPPVIQIMPRSAFADRASVPEVLSILTEGGVAGPSPAISVRSLGGAVSRVPGEATAFAHRRAELMIMTISAGPAPVVAAAGPVLDALWRRLTPHVSGLYANFLATATTADVAEIYPAHTYERLAAVKRRYDPSNLFAGNHNIRPQRG
jgi:hypothetical protein